MPHNPSSILFWNSNSLTEDKLTEVEEFTHRFQPLIFGICETRHEPEVSAFPNSPSLYDLPDYVSFRKPYASNSAGLVAFVRQSLVCRRRPELEQSAHCLALEVQLACAPRPTIIVFCYRLDSAGKQGWTALAESIRAAAEPETPLLLMGDFNARSHDFGDESSNQFGPLMSSLCDELDLTVLNNLYCYGAPTRKSSVLDLAVCNNSARSFVSGMTVGGKRGLLSDHHSIAVSLSVDNPPDPPRRQHHRWNLNTADWASFSATLEDELPAARRRCQSIINENKNASTVIDQLALELNNVLKKAADHSVPLKSHSSARKKWWQAVPDLRAKLRGYQKAKKRHYRTRQAAHGVFAAEKRAEWLAAFEQARSIRREKQFTRIFESTRLNWQALNEIHAPTSYPLNAIRNDQGKLASTREEALNLQAEHFAKVCSLPKVQHEADEAINASICNASLSVHPEMDKPFTAAEIKAQCALIKNPKSAPGPDQIPAIFLKRSPDELFELLATVFNYSWHEGKIPKLWRQANVCPLLKPGATDRTDRSNYRPISLTSTICKLMEQVVLQRLLKFVGDKIHWRQFGFKAKHGTVDGLIRLQRNIFRALTKPQSHLSIVFLDISKAFDRTWHQALLHKLFTLGVKGSAWRWCRAFLSDRQLRTAHEGDFSDWFDITAGVPQGSVLSPFLFLVFINDIFDFEHNGRRMSDLVELSLYADDIAAVPLNKNVNGDRQLVKALALLEVWAKRWRVDFSPSKSKVVRFNNYRKAKVDRLKFPLHLNGIQLEYVPAFKYLGVTWQANCKWDQHAERVMASARRASNFAASLVSNIPPRLKFVRQLSHALVRTKLAFGMPIWSAASEERWREMDKLTTEPMRRALKLPRSTSLQALLCETNTLRLKLHHEMLAISALITAQSLDPRHSTRRILEEQAEEKQATLLRTPIFVFARFIIFKREIDLQHADKRNLQAHFMQIQHHEWRNSGQCKLLFSLSIGSYVPAKKRYCLPAYFESDPPRIAATRAKLRFNRSNIKFTLRRQSIIKPDAPIDCDHCPGFDETITHVFHDCYRHSKSRQKLLIAARKANLPLSAPLRLKWLLGDVDSVIIQHKDQLLALSLSASFLFSIDRLRPL